MKLPLMKIIIVEMNGVHFLRLAAAYPDTEVNFPDGPAAISRVLSNVDAQDKELQRVIGIEQYGLVSAIFSRYPQSTPASISLSEARGLKSVPLNGPMHSAWAAGQTTQLWYLEPANNGPIITNDSKPNAFRLLNVNINYYISVSHKSLVGIPIYYVEATGSTENAATWTLKLSPDYSFHIEPQSPSDQLFEVHSDQGQFYALLNYRDTPTTSSHPFIVQVYQGSINNLGPRQQDILKPGELLIPGAYLESPSKKFRLAFEGGRFGV
ncbi:uncharacterized protein BKA55DRAFT_683942 [Fusarium redolens]|uniref:Uncharacterized protein n=1 Tax=Fusarium redolens TaxID=48865 RepID=A0A9P9KYJ4_FUSRE|nr:uncharacterized protein BKA55DRAFT_683942 [Fusarium redolens]KAH7270886.1 hypothetical protein BKA55DRAFT_683942 [Fusarium redolens]